MKRKLCRMSRGRNASARSRWRSSGQIYRAATIPHAMKLNAMLTKNQIICCGMINLSFLEFQRLTAAGGCDRVLPVAAGRGTKLVGVGVPAPPHLRVGRELRHRRERTSQCAVIAVQIEPRPEWGEH